MSEKETQPKLHFPTSTRYSLGYEPIGSQDIYLLHPSDRARIVSYETDGRRERSIRKLLIKQHLIVGNQLSDNKDNKQAFYVPKSARPMGYDASVATEGPYTYGDEELIKDVGKLLGTVYETRHKKLVLTGDLGRIAVITDFIKPGEQQLFLTPGVEKLATRLNGPVDPITYYAGKIATMGHQFSKSFDLFEDGFKQTKG